MVIPRLDPGHTRSIQNSHPSVQARSDRDLVYLCSRKRFRSEHSVVMTLNFALPCLLHLHHSPPASGQARVSLAVSRSSFRRQGQTSPAFVMICIHHVHLLGPFTIRLYEIDTMQTRGCLSSTDGRDHDLVDSWKQMHLRSALLKSPLQPDIAPSRSAHCCVILQGPKTTIDA